ncbi:TPA: ead/Ea22-like family protein [Enterobacter hormaechei]
MSNIDKRALREAAEKALPAMKRLLMMPNDELFDEALLNVDGDVDAANAFNLLTGTETVLALLDELERKEEQRANWFQMAQKLGSDLDTAEKRIAELEAIAKSVKFHPIPMEDLGNKSDGKKHPYMFGAGYNSAVVHCESVLLQAFAAAAGKGA